jgi:ribosomal-protein-alanine N-acetyltransferase
VASLLPPEAELETIAVAKEGQRHGIASLLLRALIQELEAERVSRLALEVRASNQAALRFYQARGFKQTGRRPRYYADPEEDAVLLELTLP